MVAGKSDLIEIAAEKRADREKAVAIYDGRDDDSGKEIWTWLPKSQIEDNGDGTFTMPEWLALEKGLI
jgi:hypothetical protein